MNKNKLVKELKNNPRKNMNVIGFVENNPIKQIFQKGDSYIIIGKSDHLWAYPVSLNKKELLSLIEDIEISTKYYANLQDWMIPLITKGAQKEWHLKTRRYYFPEDIFIEDPIHAVDNLNKEDIDVIIKNLKYGDHLTYETVLNRIESGISAGIRIDNSLVAWAITHDDKSLGFLHVLPQYRNRGLASDIARYLIKKKRARDEAIYINIEPDNQKSIRMSEGLGFKYDRNISWLKLK